MGAESHRQEQPVEQEQKQEQVDEKELLIAEGDWMNCRWTPRVLCRETRRQTEWPCSISSLPDRTDRWLRTKITTCKSRGLIQKKFSKKVAASLRSLLLF